MDSAYSVPLFTRVGLSDIGIGARQLTRMLSVNEIRTIRTGIYAFGSEVETLTATQRVVVRARALHQASSTPPVFSHHTAVALLGLPGYGPIPERLHVIASDARPGSAAGVVRHRSGDAPVEHVEVHGMLSTSLARTVADIARTTAFDTAVAVTDGAFAVARGVDGPASVAAFREECSSIAQLMAHGSARAERVLAFADPLADGPGESVSRVRLAQLGFAPPRLQVPVPGPRGITYRIDFGLDDVPAWGEFDGRGKYRDPALLGIRGPEDALDAEKQREDWIRGTAQRRFARWMWEHIRTPATLAARLAAFSITPP